MIQHNISHVSRCVQRSTVRFWSEATATWQLWNSDLCAALCKNVEVESCRSWVSLIVSSAVKFSVMSWCAFFSVCMCCIRVVLKWLELSERVSACLMTPPCVGFRTKVHSRKALTWQVLHRLTSFETLCISCHWCLKFVSTFQVYLDSRFAIWHQSRTSEKSLCRFQLQSWGSVPQCHTLTVRVCSVLVVMR